MDTLHVSDAIRVPQAALSLDPGMSLGEAWPLMRARKARHAAVANGVIGWGVFSLDHVWERGMSADGFSVRRDLTVREVMADIARPLHPEASLGEAVTSMREQGVMALPIVGDQGDFLGLVTERDLLAMMGRLLVEGPGTDAAERSQILLANPVLQTAMRLLDSAGI